MIHRFAIAELFGRFLADGDRGNEFRFRHVEPIWPQYERIEFDFAGVANLTDSFANGCFGNMAAEHAGDFRSKVRVLNCDPVVKSILAAAVARGLAEGSGSCVG